MQKRRRFKNLKTLEMRFPRGGLRDDVERTATQVEAASKVTEILFARESP